jgi:hypothetical protein
MRVEVVMEAPKNPSESFKRLNPHLYGQKEVMCSGGDFQAAKSTSVKTGGDASESNTHPIYPDLTARPDTDETRLNKTERAYLAHLRMLKVPHLRVQKITVKIADDCRLTPDFSYVDANGRGVFVDVKGFQREDALIKMKVAARNFSEYRFVIVTRRKGGGWDEREVNT